MIGEHFDEIKNLMEQMLVGAFLPQQLFNGLTHDFLAGDVLTRPYAVMLGQS